MARIDEYRAALRSLADPEPYLLEHCGLPGPRGNLELARVAADEADAATIHRWAGLDASVAPRNTPGEFLAFCGVVGLGRLLAAGDESVLPSLRERANDSRWRIREAVAMALQRVGERDFARLLSWTRDWSGGTALERRGAVAALCEPALLREPGRVREVLELLDAVTASIVTVADRRAEDFVALRKGLGYCWSVAVAASPDDGRPAMERWLGHDDPDVVWIMRENLGKARLARMDADWVERSRSRLPASRGGRAGR